MFNLEKSIAEWRKQMLAAGIKTPVPLDELEIHLREEIEREVKSGLNEQNAFEISVQRIGKPQTLKSEFKKIERKFMKTMKIVGGIVGVMIGAALMVPGSIELHDELIVANGKLALWLLGFILQMWAISSLWRMVRPGAARVEFEKFERSLPQIAKDGAGGVILLTGVVLAIPVAMQAGREGFVKFDALCWLIFGFALLVMGALVTFCPYKKRTA